MHTKKRNCVYLFWVLFLIPAWSRDKRDFRNIYDVRCEDLFVNPLYITKDPSNTLIYKPTVMHCMMVLALESALAREKNEQRKDEIQFALAQMKKMQNMLLNGYKFAVPGIEHSKVIPDSQQMRVEDIKKQVLKK